MAKPRAIDLFCGCGGLTLGLKQAGFSVIGAVDNDPTAVASYTANHSRVKVWETDIRKLSVSEMKRTLGLRKGELELVAGCPPCQGFSAMRTLNGKKSVRDDRNDLIYEFLRFVKGLKPKAVMMENVPGLARDIRLGTFEAELRRIGYIVHHDIFNAADYGVPQRRRRLILLAALNKEIPFAEPAPRRVTVRDAIGSLPRAGKSGDPLHDVAENRSKRVIERIRKIPRDGGSRNDLGRRAQLKCHKKCNGFKDVYGRMAWDKVAPTITSGCFNPSKGRFLHPQKDRTITLREAALLQGFPKSYFISTGRGKTHAALLIGNALPPQFICVHALMIRELLSSSRGKLAWHKLLRRA